LADFGEGLPLMFLVKRAEDLKFTLWSSGLEMLSGIPADAIVGTIGSEVFPEDHLRGYQLVDHEVVDQRGPVVVDEPIATPDGTRWICTRKVPLVGPSGEVSHIVGMCEDITTIREVESSRAAERAALERTIELRDWLVASAAHDFNSPLGILDICVANLHRRAEAGADEELDRTAARLGRAARSMSGLVTDLSAEAAVRAGKLHLERRWHDVRVLLRDATEQLAPIAAQRGVTLRVEGESARLAVACDGPKVTRVLDNLLTNALKFTPQGGVITASARLMTVGGVLVSVADSGPGIRPEDRERIFEPYWQAAPSSGRGLGLGLTIAKKLVEAHGGRLWVESEPGQGALFRFTLPRVSGGSA
jgi:PAS domain S-box-containing protein